MNLKSRPLVQDLVKQAMSNAAERAQIASEGARQMKIAGEKCAECGKESCECSKKAASSDGSISTDYAMKLAAAIEYATPAVMGLSKAAAPNAPPANITEHVQAQPEGVTASNVSGTMPGPGQQGHGHAQPPTNPGVQKAHPQEHGATQLENNKDQAPGGPGTQTTAMSGGQGKTAAPLMGGRTAKVMNFANKAKGAVQTAAKEAPVVKTAPKAENWLAQRLRGVEKPSVPFGKSSSADELYLKNLQSLGTKVASAKAPAPGDLSAADGLLSYVKQAEDAINPAQISAGPAVPPESNASGEAGGEPVGGAPKGPSSLVSSNESAINYKRQTAYAPRKSELAAYFNEPALSSATDKTLNEAFAHTGEAGVKISSEQLVKSAASRALLSKLAAAATSNQA